MTSYTASPLIYIIDAASAVCASVQYVLETTKHDVFPVGNAEYFSADIFQTGRVRREDIVLIDLETNLTSNFRLLNLMMTRRDGPGIILLSERGGAFRSTDCFDNPRISLLQTPVRTCDVLSCVETIS